MSKLPHNTQNTKTPKHTTRCKHEGWRELYLHQSAASTLILDCIYEAQPDLALLDILSEYLSAQGSKTMTEYVHNRHSPFRLLSEVQNRLGWDNFIEGRISTLWLEVMTPFLVQSGGAALLILCCLSRISNGYSATLGSITQKRASQHHNTIS